MITLRTIFGVNYFKINRAIEEAEKICLACDIPLFARIDWEYVKLLKCSNCGYTKWWYHWTQTIGEL